MVYIAWDDQLKIFNYRSRTANPKWKGLKSTPAVVRFYPEPREKMGDYRVNISEWDDEFIERNNDTDGKKFRYWGGKKCALFNKTGFPMLAYISMSGNLLQGEKVGNFYKFVTLKPDDLNIAKKMTHETHPQFIHRFSIIGWRKQGKGGITTRKTTTPHGIIDWPLITKEGIAYIPWTLVIPQ